MLQIRLVSDEKTVNLFLKILSRLPVIEVLRHSNPSPDKSGEGVVVFADLRVFERVPKVESRQLVLPGLGGR